jgi:hypothetical protein
MSHHAVRSLQCADGRGKPAAGPTLTGLTLFNDCFSAAYVT